MQLTAEKAAYIEEKLKQFKLVDMRQQYSDIIREAESSSMDYLEFFMRLINAEDESKNNRRTEKLLANAVLICRQHWMTLITALIRR